MSRKAIIVLSASTVIIFAAVAAVFTACARAQDELDRSLRELLPPDAEVVWSADCGANWVLGGEGCARAMVSPRDRPLDQRIKAVDLQAAEAGWKTSSSRVSGASTTVDLEKGDLVATIVLVSEEALKASCPREDEFQLQLCNDSFKVERR